MQPQELIEKTYITWKEVVSDNDGVDDNTPETSKKLIFLSNAILDITTYDEELDITFGYMILETMHHIKNKTTHAYIEDAGKYPLYILSCNFIKDWIEWGTSIRGAWFKYGQQIEFFKGFVINQEENDVLLTDEFIQWFLDWFNN